MALFVLDGLIVQLLEAFKADQLVEQTGQSSPHTMVSCSNLSDLLFREKRRVCRACPTLPATWSEPGRRSFVPGSEWQTGPGGRGLVCLLDVVLTLGFGLTAEDQLEAVSAYGLGATEWLEVGIVNFAGALGVAGLQPSSRSETEP